MLRKCEDSILNDMYTNESSSTEYDFYTLKIVQTIQSSYFCSLWECEIFTCLDNTKDVEA